MLRKRHQEVGEEFNLETGHVTLYKNHIDTDNGLEKIAEVLERFGIDVIDIDSGWSDMVIKFEKQ